MSHAWSSGPHVELGVTSGLPDGTGVLNGLITKDLSCSDVDERRGQPGQISRSRRCRVGGDIAGPSRRAEQSLPAGDIADAVPDADAVKLRRRRGCASVIEHRVVKDLCAQGRTTAITCRQGQTRRKSTTCARAGDHDAIPTDPDPIGIFREPQECGVHVFAPVGVRVLRRQSVLHGDEHCTKLVDPIQDKVDAAEPVAEHQPTRVSVQNRGYLPFRVSVPQHREHHAYTVMPHEGVIRAFNASLAHDVVERRRSVRRPHEVDQLRGDGGREHPTHHGEACLQLWIEGRARW